MVIQMNRRRRRNLRGKGKIKEIISNKQFKVMIYILTLIIFLCICIICGRFGFERIEFAKQKKEIEKEIEAIYISSNKDELNEENEENQDDIIVSITAVGDILCGRQVLNDAYNIKDGTYDFNSMFSKVKRIVRNSDIAIGTMETNFVDEQYQTSGKFNSPIEFAKAVKNSGINVVATAQNHVFDYGYDGLIKTDDALSNLGISTTGTKTSQEDKTYLIKSVKGIKIAFLAYTCDLNNNNISEEEIKNVNIFSEEKLKQDIELVKSEGAEFLCTYMHWGDVNSNNVSQQQNDMTEILLRNNVDLILGTHPAVIQKMEIKQNEKGNNVLVAYSLGNYISDFVYNDSNVELFLNIQLRKDGETKEVTMNKVTYTPIYVLDNGTKAENRFELVDMQGIAKEYAEGNTKIVNKNVYQKLVNGLKVIEKIIR